MSYDRNSFFAALLAPGSLREKLGRIRTLSSGGQGAERRSSAHVYRMDYTRGPMGYIAQWMCRRMEQSGYPSRVHCVYRSPEEQQDAFERGVSKARAFQSPHQYYAAADIIHAVNGWNVSQAYWDALQIVRLQAEEEFNIRLVSGYNWGWDFAHHEIESWREFRDLVGNREPTPEELVAWFQELLPQVWRNRPLHARGHAPDDDLGRLGFAECSACKAVYPLGSMCPDPRCDLSDPLNRDRVSGDG